MVLVSCGCVCYVVCRDVRRMDRAGEAARVVAWAPPSAWWMLAPMAPIGHHAGPQHQQHESGVIEAVRAETVEITRINCDSDGGGEGAPPFGPCTTQGARGRPHHDSLAHTSFVMVCVCSCSSSCTPAAHRFRLTTPPPSSSHELPSTRSVERGDGDLFSLVHTVAHMYLACGSGLLLSRKWHLVRSGAGHSAALTSPPDVPPVRNDDPYEEGRKAEDRCGWPHPSSLHPR